MIVSSQAYSALSCEDSFSSESNILTGKSPNVTTVRLFTPEQIIREKVQEWGERTLGRNLDKIELDLLVVFYERKPSSAVKTQVLHKRSRNFRELNFSKKEIEILSQREIKPDFTEAIKINIPERTQEEKKLKAQGFNAAYRRGIDEVNEWIAVREQLVKLKADPYLTHVDYFAEKMREHIGYIEEGVTTTSQIRNLDRLKKYAKILIEKKQVSYYRWLKFSLSLSRILDEKTSFIWYQDGYFDINEKIVKSFPDYIAIPTTIGEMGIIAMNKGSAHGVHPLGLIREKNSLYFFSHDVSHYTPDRSSGLIYNKLIEHTKGLPLEKRKNIELAYFILIHEGDLQVKILDPKNVVLNIQNQVELVVRPDNEEMRGLIDLSHNLDKKVQTLINDFLEVYLPVQKEAET